MDYFHLGSVVLYIAFTLSALINKINASSAFVENAQVKQSVNGQREYDYIVIGGGTSGLVVANRLSEDSSSMYVSMIFTLHSLR